MSRPENETMAAAAQAWREVFASRDEVIVSRCRAGESKASVARDYGITRQRVQQIVHAAGRAKRRKRNA